MTVRDLHFKQEIRELTPLDADYPERLRNISDPPRTLYVRGSLPPDDRPTVAIIGARSASDYGLQVARSFGRALAMQGIGIISGMAAGIDSAGQWGAVDAEAKTYAVFGCGLNVCYPARNYLLYDKILEYGGGAKADLRPARACHGRTLEGLQPADPAGSRHPDESGGCARVPASHIS